MAASGSKSVKVTNFNTLKFTWAEASQSIVDNSTVVNWVMQLVAGSNGKIVSSVKKDWKVVINGTTYKGEVSHGIENNTTKTLASGKTTIVHNADGSKTFSYSFSMDFTGLTFAGEAIGKKSGSGTGELTTIPRQATITAAPNFNDEDNPSITYSNPAGEIVESLAACISLDGSAANIAYRDISKTGTSYTFQLTDAERNILRNATTTANSRSVFFYIRTVIGGNTYYSNVAKTFTVVNAQPSINPSVYDGNSTTTTLTGDANVFVRYHSNAVFNINAVAKKGASITSQQVTVGSLKSTAASGVLNAVDDSVFNFYAADSRGNKAEKQVNKTLIPYVKLTCYMSVEPPSTDGKMTLRANGSYYNGSFGATANTLTIQYRYKTNSGSYTNWYSINAAFNGNSYEAAASLTGLNYLNSYTFQCRAVDKLEEAITPAKTVKTMPVFDWSAEDFNFNVPVNFAAGATGVGDYGVWKPALNASAVSAYTNQEGWYIKSGNVVTVGFFIKATCKSGYESTSISISGLPFNPSITASGGGMCSGAYVSSGFTFQCWAAATNGSITARVQQVNHTTATNLATSASGCFYRNSGGEITLSGTITYITT